MNSHYKRGEYKNRSAKQKTSTSTKESSESITNKKTDNIVLKGGDLCNYHISGKELNENLF